MLIALALLASWPFFETLGYAPMTADPPTWISRGTPLSAEWLTWVFARDHYSWYRPVTALSFAFNQVVSDVNPWAFRATDLALHLAVGWLAGAVFRRWVPRTSPWAGVVVCAIVWVHPIAEEVVPYMARRSYSLSACFGLAALWGLHGAVERARTGGSSLRASLGVGVLLTLALLSNEGALTIVLVAPLLAGTRLLGRPEGPGGPQGTRRAGGLAQIVRLLLPAAGVVALTMALRCWVIGGLGGYGQDSQGQAIGLGALVSLGGVVSGLEIWSSALGVVGVLVLVGFAGGYYLTVARRALRSEAHPAERLLLVGLLWIALAGVLFLFAGIYTERQAYGLQVPLAFVLVGAWCARRSWLDALAPVLLLGTLLWASPVVHGQHAPRLAGWAERQALLTALATDLATCERPAVVRVVLPNMRRNVSVRSVGGEGSSRLSLHRSIRQPLVWTQIALHDHTHELDLRDFLYYPRDGEPGRLEQRRGRPALRLPSEGPLYLRRGPDFFAVAPDSVLWLDELNWPADANGYIYVWGPSGGQLKLLQPAPR